VGHFSRAPKPVPLHLQQAMVESEDSHFSKIHRFIWLRVPKSTGTRKVEPIEFRFWLKASPIESLKRVFATRPSPWQLEHFPFPLLATMIVPSQCLHSRAIRLSWASEPVHLPLALADLADLRNRPSALLI